MSRNPSSTSRGRGIPQSGIRAPCVPTSRSIQRPGSYLPTGERPEMSGIRRPNTQQSMQRPEERSLRVPVSTAIDRSRLGAIPRTGGLSFQRGAPQVIPQVCPPPESTRDPRTRIIPITRETSTRESTPREPSQMRSQVCPPQERIIPITLETSTQESTPRAPSQMRPPAQASTLRPPSQMRPPAQASTLRQPSQMRPPAQASMLRPPSQMRPSTATQASMLRAPSQMRPSTVTQAPRAAPQIRPSTMATDISTSRAVPRSSTYSQPAERTMRSEIRVPCREETVVRPETRNLDTSSRAGVAGRLAAIPRTLPSSTAGRSALNVPQIKVTPPDDSSRVSSIAPPLASSTFRAGSPCEITAIRDISAIPGNETRKFDLSMSRCIPKSGISAGPGGRTAMSRIGRPGTQTRADDSETIPVSRGAETSRLGAIPKTTASRIQRGGPQLSFQTQRSVCPPAQTTPHSSTASSMSRTLDPCARNVPPASSALRQSELGDISEIPESAESTTGISKPTCISRPGAYSRAGERSEISGIGRPSTEQSIRRPEARSMLLPVSRSDYTSRLGAIPRTGGLSFQRRAPQETPQVCPPQESSRSPRTRIIPITLETSTQESTPREPSPCRSPQPCPSMQSTICPPVQSPQTYMRNSPTQKQPSPANISCGPANLSKRENLSLDPCVSLAPSASSPSRRESHGTETCLPTQRSMRSSGADRLPSEISDICGLGESGRQESIEKPDTSARMSPASRSGITSWLRASPPTGDSSIFSPLQRSPQSSPDCSPPRRSPQSSPDCSPPRRSPQSSPDCPQPQRNPQSSPDCPQQRRTPQPSPDPLPVCPAQAPELDPVSKDSEQKVEEEGKEPEKYTLVQLRGSSKPKWFPGYLCAFPDNVYLGPEDSVVKKANSPEEVLFSAWLSVSPDSFPMAN